jgi:Uncharacterized membrane protein, required for colicin V production
MNWFDLVVLILVLLALIKGFFSGFVMQIAMLAGLILGAIFAGKLSELIAPELIKLTDVSPHIMAPLSYIVAFIAILVALFFAGKLVESFIKAVKLNTFNRIAGALFCSLKWIVLFSILLNLLVEFDRDKKIIKEDIRENAITYSVVSEVAQTVIPYLRFDWTN